MHAKTLFMALFVASMLASAAASAQDKVVDEDLVQKKVKPMAEEGQEDGWHFSLDLSGSFNLGHSRAMVDKPSGVSVALGGGFGTGLLYLSGPHEWSASLGWKFGLARTPDLGSLTKSQDEFFFQTRYLYTFEKVGWLGVFAKLRLESALLPGWQVVVDETSVRELDHYDVELTGSPYTVGSGGKVNLTGPFSPLLIKEKAGAMATPVDRKEVKLQVDLGLGSHQLVLFDDTFRLDDDKDTPELELRLLRQYVQVGAALEARLTGTPHEVFEYAVGAEVMQPFYTSIGSDLKGFELINVRLDALLRLKVYKYVMVDLTVDAKYYPLVTDRWQVATNLLVTFHYEYFAREVKKESGAGDDADAK